MQREPEGAFWWPARLPAQGERLGPAHADSGLARALVLPAGRRLCFETRENGGPWRYWEAETVITLTGQTRLTAAGGASAAFVHTGSVLAFFDRDGPADPWLDLLLLAVGLTPLADARQWRDSPPARLFPVRPAMRAWLWLTRPLGAFLDSCYQRAWQEPQGVWRQSAVHLLTPAPGWRVRLETLALISPHGGLVHLAARGGADSPFDPAQDGGWQREMRLASVGQNADEGIPAWKVNVHNIDDIARLTDNRGEIS